MNEPIKRKRGRPKKVKGEPKKDTKCEEEKRNDKGDTGGSNRGKKGKKVKSTTKPKPKTTAKGIKSVIPSPEKSNEIERKESEHDEVERQTPKPQTRNKTTRKKHDKVKSKSRGITEKTRVRTAEEYREAMRFLEKRKYFSKTNEEVHKYTYMIDKLERLTRII